MLRLQIWSPTSKDSHLSTQKPFIKELVTMTQEPMPITLQEAVSILLVNSTPQWITVKWTTCSGLFRVSLSIICRGEALISWTLWSTRSKRSKTSPGSNFRLALSILRLITPQQQTWLPRLPKPLRWLTSAALWIWWPTRNRNS